MPLSLLGIINWLLVSRVPHCSSCFWEGRYPPPQLDSRGFKSYIDDGKVPQQNVEKARKIQTSMGDEFSAFDAFAEILSGGVVNLLRVVVAHSLQFLLGYCWASVANA